MSFYFIVFVALSLAGWVYECTYCSFREGKWQNRGFLYGPICPIYGAGAVAAIAIARHLPGLFSTQTPAWRVFLTCAALSAVLEYTTSYVLEKLFHAVWWDYSDMPLNLHGRICLPATTLFGLAGLAIVRCLVPVEARLDALTTPLFDETVSLILAFWVGIDTGLTVNSLLQLGERLDAMQGEFDQVMERRFVQLRSAPAALGATARGAEQEVAALVARYKGKLSPRQSYLLSNMSFRGPRIAMASRLKGAGESVRKHLEALRTQYTPEEYQYIHEEDQGGGD